MNIISFVSWIYITQSQQIITDMHIILSIYLHYNAYKYAHISIVSIYKCGDIQWLYN